MYTYEIEYTYTKTKKVIHESMTPITKSEWIERLKQEHGVKRVKISSFVESGITQSELCMKLFGKDLTQGAHALKVCDSWSGDWRYYSSACIQIVRHELDGFTYVYVSEGEATSSEGYELNHVDPSVNLVWYEDQDQFYVELLRDVVDSHDITLDQVNLLVESMKK